MQRIRMARQWRATYTKNRLGDWKMKPKEEKKPIEPKQEPLVYDYIQLLGLTTKYDMDNIDIKLIAEIVYDYLDKNVRW